MQTTKQIVDTITEQMEITWGGSGFERVVFEWIVEHVPQGSVACELGAGWVSTKCLSLWCELYSVENDERFMEPIYPTTYIHAPEKNGWYDVDILREKLPPIEKQDFILIDGIGRPKMLENMELFNRNAFFVIHDTNRPLEAQFALDLAKELGRPAIFHTEGDFWVSI